MCLAGLVVIIDDAAIGAELVQSQSWELTIEHFNATIDFVLLDEGFILIAFNVSLYQSSSLVGALGRYTALRFMRIEVICER